MTTHRRLANNVAPRNRAGSASSETAWEEAVSERPARRGRPRVWESPKEKEQAHRARRAERLALLGSLLLAVLNAEWDDPVMRRVVLDGDEFAVLRALIRYYQDRSWSRLQWLESCKRKEEQQEPTAPPKPGRRGPRTSSPA